MNRTAIATLMLMIPGLASADVTPEDVWSNMQAAYSAMGLSVSGNATRTGDTLSITDGVVTLTYPIIGGQATATLPQMGLIDQGDGTVRIVTPDSYLLEIAADIPEENEQVSFEIAIAQSGMNSIASGEAGDVTYTTEVADFDMIMNALSIPGEQLDFNMEFDSDGYAGVTQITEGDNLTIVSDLDNRATTTRFSMDIEGIQQESTSEGGAVKTLTTIVLPPDMNIMNLTPALMAGLSITSSLQAEASSGTTTSTMNGELFSEQVQNTGPATAELSFDQSGFAMIADVVGFDATITQMDILPFPIEIKGAGAGGNFAFPLVASDAPQDFRYAINMTGLEIADGLWGMVDPGASLDRSPIDVVIDFGGTLDWGLDTFDIAALMELDQTGATPPIKLLSADLNDMTLNVLGGSVMGNGSFTFDNSDMTSFDGLPRPEGKATFSASGLNAVIDQLVGTGLLPEDQAGMGRMFMGMFARSTGEDALETEVEVNAEGHLLLNGQRMR